MPSAYIRFGFTCIETEDLQKPPCVLCGSVFSNANLRPSELQEHLDNLHGGTIVVDHDEISLQVKEPLLILEQPFQN